MSKALLAEFTVKAGAEARVAGMVTELAGHVRQEPGSLTFAVSAKEEDSRAYWIYEVYRDEQAFRAHLVAPYGGAVQRRADRPDRGGRLRPDVSDRAPMSWHSTATRTALSEVGRA
jgi:quinol monooxygenase YgiN